MRPIESLRRKFKSVPGRIKTSGRPEKLQKLHHENADRSSQIGSPSIVSNVTEYSLESTQSPPQNEFFPTEPAELTCPTLSAGDADTNNLCRASFLEQTGESGYESSSKSAVRPEAFSGETEEFSPRNGNFMLSPEVQLEAEQELRSREYVDFDGEHESDYTGGPVRFVIATDGVKESCGALLMNLDLSQKIQSALHRQRDFARAQRVHLRKKKVSSNFAMDLEVQIANHRRRLLAFKKGADGGGNEQKELQEELEVLERMVEDNAMRQREIDTDLRYKADTLRRIQAAANEPLEEAFVAARLLPRREDRPDTPIPELDLKEEYKSFRARAQEGDEDYKPLHTREEHHAELNPPTAEEEQEEELNRRYWKAQGRLNIARAILERKNEDRWTELCARNQALERGEMPTDRTQAEFDHRWVQRIQEITREITKAEADLAEAKAAARDVGVNVNDAEQASDFAIDVDDGKMSGKEEEYIALAPVDRINKWLSLNEEAASSNFGNRTEMDWEAEDLEFGASSSAIADGSRLRHIENWRNIKEVQLKGFMHEGKDLDDVPAQCLRSKSI